MTFPSEPVIIQLEELLPTDIIIEDRKLVALGGNTDAVLATQASNTATKSSFYSKLIVSLADNIRSRNRKNSSSGGVGGDDDDDETEEWTFDTYKVTTEKIIDLVTNPKNSSQFRRFVWYRQFPKAHYVVMTRMQTINKLANDLDCQMRKIEARELAEAQEVASKQQLQQRQRQQKPNLLHQYAQSLIYKVCRAVRKGMSPYQAALLLDHPIVVKVAESSSSPSNNPSSTEEINAEKPVAEEDVEARSNNDKVESESERKLRLLLRHRFLACIRSKQCCIFDFANALLTMWGIPNISKVVPKSKKRKKLEVSTTRMTTTTTAPSRKKKKVEGTTATTTTGTAVLPQNIGPWNREERIVFLNGLQQFGPPNWVRIASLITTRTHKQVTSYGRSIMKKFQLELYNRHIPDDLREFLLRTED